MLYPFKFYPVYKDYIWGGRNLSRFGKQLPEGKVAESWELACHADGMSVVRNGIYEGRTLKSMIEEFGEEILGDIAKENHGFPLLIKLIDANDKLSVQVHPDDEFARMHENDNGKNEMWYILDAKPGAKLVYGLKPGVAKEDFERAVMENKIENCLNYISVKPGDFVNIPAGLVHAICEGIVLAEIQQSSNVTYRVYDYNRKDAKGNYRPLHVEKAMQVINFDSRKIKYPYEGLEYKNTSEARLKILVANKYFCVELYEIKGSLTESTSGGKFHAYVCISGEGEIKCKSGNVRLVRGETVLIPACVYDYCLEGNMALLKTYVPDLDNDIYQRLAGIGFEKREITQKIAGLE